MEFGSLIRVILFVSDIKKMADFYQTAFGLQLINQESGFVTLDSGSGWQLSLHAIPEISVHNQPRQDSYIKYVFYSGDVETDRENLLKKGVSMMNIVKLYRNNNHEQVMQKIPP